MIEGNHKGLFGGGLSNKASWIQFNTQRWAFSDFNHPDINEPSNLKTSAFMIFGKKVRKTLDVETATEALFETDQVRSVARVKHNTAIRIEKDLGGRKTPETKKRYNENEGTWTFDIPVDSDEDNESNLDTPQAKSPLDKKQGKVDTALAAMMAVGQLVSQSERHKMEKDQAMALMEIQRFWGGIAYTIAKDTRDTTSYGKKPAIKKPNQTTN